MRDTRSNWHHCSGRGSSVLSSNERVIFRGILRRTVCGGRHVSHLDGLGAVVVVVTAGAGLCRDDAIGRLRRGGEPIARLLRRRPGFVRRGGDDRERRHAFFARRRRTRARRGGRGRRRRRG